MDDPAISVVKNLEQLVCQGLGVEAPSDSLRRIKIRGLLSGLGKPQVDLKESFKQAVEYFESQAPKPREFQQRLQRCSQQNIKGHQELLVILHSIANDPQLKILCGPEFKLETGEPSAATATSRLQAQGAVARRAPAATHAPGPIAAQRTGAASAAPTAPVAFSAPAVGTPGPQPTTSAHGTGYSTPLPSMPAVFTPMQPPAMPAATQGTVPAAQQGQNRHIATKAAPVSAARASSPHNAPGKAGNAGRSTPHYDNPFYGQADAASPAVRQKEYTPTLEPTINWGAARMKHTAPPGLPTPNISAAGDLFIMPEPKVGAGSTGLEVAGAVLGLQGLQLPDWDRERPHLTGLDLVYAARDNAAAMQQGLLHQGTAEAKEALSRLQPQLQELAIMNDLLYVFMGLDGKYVRAVMVQPQDQEPGAAPDGVRAGPYVTFVVAPGLDPCLHELVERVLPLCEYGAVLQRFVETRSEFSRGLVSHAVAAAVRALLEDWKLMVTQLEHQLRLGSLTLQALVFHCQGPLASLGLLAHLAAHAASHSLTSAGLLNLLHAKASALAGDRVAQALLHNILHAAAVPYFKMLERWLCEGVLQDSRGEFMVMEDKAVTKEALTEDRRVAYWYTRYTLRPVASAATTASAATSREASPSPTKHIGAGGSGGRALVAVDVPVFLRDHVDTILATGKYLNVLRECGCPHTVKLPSGQSLAFDPSNRFLQAVQSAHASASAALLQLLLKERGMLGWLRSLKHWFLMDAGDMVVGLCEVMGEELGKAARDVSRPRLQSLLELALRTSSVGQDPHVDDVAAELDPRSLLELARAAGVTSRTNHNSISSATASVTTTPGSTPARGAATSRQPARPRAEDLPGWEMLLLSCRVAWPMNLVVPPRALARYQLIFRLLWGLKYAERELSAAWHRMQAARNAARSGREALKPVYALCYRQLWMVKEVVRYTCVDVLEPAWRTLEEGVRRAGDVDTVIQCQEQFLSIAMDGLLLSRPNLLRPLAGLQQGALAFCARVNKGWDTLDAQVEAAAQAAAAAKAAQAQLQRGTSATVAGGRAGRVSATDAAAPASTTGTQRTGITMLGSVSEGLAALSAKREAGYASLAAKGMHAQAGARGAAGGVPERAQQPAPITANAIIDLGTLADDLANTLGELVGGLQALHQDAVRRDVGVSADGHSQALLETREGLDALQGLIDRLDLGVSGAGGAGTAGVAGATSTRAAYNALAAQAAALR